MRPQALAVDSFQTIRVPSANPQGSYLYQYHEYEITPPASGWRVIAAQGAFTSTGFANVPLDLADLNGDLLMSSDAGTASPGNENWDWQPNYLVVNGNQPLPADLAVRVQPDNQPTSTHNNKGYYLQSQTAWPAPILPGFGISTTVPITLMRELVRGQMFNFAEDTTVEIKIPYASAGLNPEYGPPLRPAALCSRLHLWQPYHQWRGDHPRSGRLRNRVFCSTWAGRKLAAGPE